MNAEKAAGLDISIRNERIMNLGICILAMQGYALIGFVHSCHHCIYRRKSCRDGRHLRSGICYLCGNENAVIYHAAAVGEADAAILDDRKIKSLERGSRVGAFAKFALQVFHLGNAVAVFRG